jgi:hypothetical protein
MVATARGQLDSAIDMKTLIFSVALMIASTSAALACRWHVPGLGWYGELATVRRYAVGASRALRQSRPLIRVELLCSVEVSQGL